MVLLKIVLVLFAVGTSFLANFMLGSTIKDKVTAGQRKQFIVPIVALNVVLLTLLAIGLFLI